MNYPPPSQQARPPEESPQSQSEPTMEQTSVAKTLLRVLTWERWLLLLIAIGAMGYGLYQWLGPKPAGQRGGPPMSRMQGPPPRPVVTTRLKTGATAETISVAGQVEASATTTLRSQVSGTVQGLRVKEGDRVTPGQIIAQVDSTDQQLNLAQAQARLAEAKSELAELKRGSRREVIAQRQAVLAAAKARETEARDNLKRIEQLVKEGALADRRLIEARTAIDTTVSDRLAAQANLAEAQAGPRRDEIAAEEAKVVAQQAAVNQAAVGVNRAQIIATASGVVNKRIVNPGDYVRSADPVLELVNNSSVDILLQVPESLSSQVQPGLAVQLSSRAIPGWRREATIDALMPTTSDQSRRRPARIRVSNPPAGLLPGTAVQGSFNANRNQGGYTISRDALTRRGNQWLVFGVESGPQGMSAKEIAVELVSDAGETVVINGPQLSDGLEIVLKGSDALSDKAPIMVMQGPSASPPPSPTPN